MHLPLLTAHSPVRCQVRYKCCRHNILDNRSKIADPGACPSAGWKVLPWVHSHGGCGWPGTTWPLPRELFNISHEKILCEMCPCCLTACFCASFKAENRTGTPRELLFPNLGLILWTHWGLVAVRSWDLPLRCVLKRPKRHSCCTCQKSASLSPMCLQDFGAVCVFPSHKLDPGWWITKRLCRSNLRHPVTLPSSTDKWCIKGI